jgi:hypothetical protein
LLNSLLAWLIAIAQNLLASLLFSLLGVVLGIYGIDRYRRWRDEDRFGGWHVIVTKLGDPKVDRPISVRKAKEILDESSELSVFIKGVVSPYARLNCDILDKEKYPRLLIQDDTKRHFIVNLDENPPAENDGGAKVL